MREYDSRNDGWNDWSNHILKELERLNANLETMKEEFQATRQVLQSEISDLRADMAKVKGLGYTLDDIKAWRAKYEDEAVLNKVREIDTWKETVSDVMTPANLKEMKRDVENLKTFKARTNMIWTVITAGLGILAAVLGVMQFMAK